MRELKKIRMKDITPLQDPEMKMVRGGSGYYGGGSGSNGGSGVTHNCRVECRPGDWRTYWLTTDCNDDWRSRVCHAGYDEGATCTCPE